MNFYLSCLWGKNVDFVDIIRLVIICWVVVLSCYIYYYFVMIGIFYLMNSSEINLEIWMWFMWLKVDLFEFFDE